MRRDNQVLVFDADDTLWENNIRFEQAIESFLDLVTAADGDRTAARAELDRIEAANARTLGYGAKVFGRSLVECFEVLQGRSACAEEADRLAELAASITAAEVELIPGVAEILAELAMPPSAPAHQGRHRRAAGQGRQLRSGAPLPVRAHRRREGAGDLPPADRGAVADPGDDLDDR